MLVIVEVKKFKNDKQFYNKSYCDYILKNWERYQKAISKKLETVKQNGKIEFYTEQYNQASINICNIKEVISYL